MGKPGSALQPGKRIALGAGVGVETIEVLADGHRRVRFVGATAEEAIARFGRLPLPPYITRDPTELDEERYQTVYARAEGSVAAPTAGLHFTPSMLDALSAQGRADRRARPAGRARAPSSRSRWTTPREHPMHPERYEISPRLAALVELVREQGGRVWAVGTTVVRALESAADERRHACAPAPARPACMITPGLSLPRGGPPAHQLPPAPLHPAHAGERLRRPRARPWRPTRHAVAQRYRFYSYGDAMVIL